MKFSQDFAPISVLLESATEIQQLHELVYYGKQNAIKQMESTVTGSSDRDILQRRIEAANRVLNYLNPRLGG